MGCTHLTATILDKHLTSWFVGCMPRPWPLWFDVKEPLGPGDHRGLGHGSQQVRGRGGAREPRRPPGRDPWIDRGTGVGGRRTPGGGGGRVGEISGRGGGIGVLFGWFA